MLTGGAVVGGTYYSTTVTLPEELPLPLASTMYASDGTTRIAKLGEFNRVFVTVDQIPEHVQRAVASAEDRKFYEHSGVDYVGIARAAWNNFTGGTRQGASTITQQYARNAMDLQEVSYARKVREAVLASKLTDRYDKSEIMGFYLNTIYFGRGAYGIEAAAQQYFGKSVADLSVAEGAVIAAVIKQPEPDATTGHQGYDPAVNEAEAKVRWEYVIGGMVEMGWLPEAERPTEYPEIREVDPNSCIIDCGINTPEGNVINYVRDEMVQMGICTPDTCSQELRQGGYRVVTTIDAKMQDAAEKAIWRKAKGSAMEGQPENLMAAMVAIDPETGRVLAYFGGDNGTGHDYAGRNYENGQWTGGHSPGSTFKIYTLAAALDNDISVDSHWTAKPFKVEGTEIQVQNAGRNASCGEWCSLEFSTVQSYNVPFYHVTEQIGADKVVGMAKAAGVATMWNTADNKPYDLTTADPKEVAPSPFFNVVGYGQYPVTVLDHANGVATLANRGVYNKAHFVISVEKKNLVSGEWVTAGGEQLKPEQRIRQEVVADLTDVLTQIPNNINRDLNGGRPVAGKTGTWELNESSGENGDAWMVGYTPQIATAVWVGNVGDRKAIRDKNNNKIGGSGLPAIIWQRFMNEAHKGMDVEQFPAAREIGSVDAGNGKSPAPPPPDPQRPGRGGICDGPLGDLFCPGGGNNGDNNGNNDGDQGDDGAGNPTGTPGNGTDPNDGDDQGGDGGIGFDFGGGAGGTTVPPTLPPPTR